MTVEDPLSFDGPTFDDVSRECQDLLTKLLIKDPEKRIKLVNALQHPWFKECGPVDMNTGLPQM